MSDASPTTSERTSESSPLCRFLYKTPPGRRGSILQAVASFRADITPVKVRAGHGKGDACTPMHKCSGHEAKHVHGPNCGHPAIPHGTCNPRFRRLGHGRGSYCGHSAVRRLLKARCGKCSESLWLAQTSIFYCTWHGIPPIPCRIPCRAARTLRRLK